MHNQLLVCTQTKPVEQYLQTLISKHKLNLNQVIQINQAQEPILIDQIRQITRLTARDYTKTTFFVFWNFGSASAIVQNAFLKTLEEHQTTIVFILITRTISSILPTIQSRCQITYIASEKQELLDKQIKELAVILEIAQKTPDFLLSSRLHLSPKNKKQQALSFLEDFLSYLSQQLITTKPRQSLTQYAQKALITKELIEINNVDPGIALDQIFL